MKNYSICSRRQHLIGSLFLNKTKLLLIILTLAQLSIKAQVNVNNVPLPEGNALSSGYPMKAYNGALYMVMDQGFFKFDGDIYIEVPLPGNLSISQDYTMEVFDGKLYLVLEDGSNGIHGALYGYEDGEFFTQVTLPTDYRVSQFHGLKAYSGDLYVVLENGSAGIRGALYTYDGTDLTQVTLPANHQVNTEVNMQVYDGMLHLLMQGDGLGLYGYDGMDFSEITLPENFDISYEHNIKTYGDDLYLVLEDGSEGIYGRPYKYDGISITAVPISGGFRLSSEYPMIENDGILYMTLEDGSNGTYKALHQYNGSTVTQVELGNGFELASDFYMGSHNNLLNVVLDAESSNGGLYTIEDNSGITQIPLAIEDCGRNILELESGAYANIGSGITGFSYSSGTIEAWVRKDNWNDPLDDALFSNGIGFNDPNSFYVSFHNIVGLHFRYGGSETGNVAAFTDDSSTDFEAGSWHHIAATWHNDGNSTTLKTYIDGVLHATATTSTNLVLAGGVSFGIGEGIVNATNDFQGGSIIEFRLWDIARTENQILTDKNEVLHGTEPNLIGYWPFNDASGSTSAANLVQATEAATLKDFTDIQNAWINYPLGIQVDEKLLISGGSYDFMDVFIGASSANTTFTIVNTGVSSIDFSENPFVTLGGDNPSEFTIDLTNTATTLEPGGSTTFDVSFNPVVGETRNAQLLITSVAGCSNPYTVNLTGTGVRPTISFHGDGFSESTTNIGEVEGAIYLKLVGDTFNDENEDRMLDLETEVELQNIPEGLMPTIELLDEPESLKLLWQDYELAGDEFWTAITYGNGIFVALSINGDLATSTDGITWTKGAAVNNFWAEVKYLNGQFIAVAYNFSGGSLIMTSPDGLNWTGQNAGITKAWTSVSFGNGLYVAVSSDNHNQVITSPDGVNWTPRTIEQYASWLSVTYGNGVFVAVGTSGENRVMYSTDGINWTVTTAAESNEWSSVTYGDGLFVAVSTTGTNRVMTSPDGINWTARPGSTSLFWSGINYLDGLFVATSLNTAIDQIMVSSDGINWITQTGVIAGNWRNATFGDNKIVSISDLGKVIHGISVDAKLTLTGNANTHQSAQDIEGIVFSFTDAAFSHNSASQVLYTPNAGLGVTFIDNNGELAFSGKGFTETMTNDGAVTGSIVITLNGGETFQDEDEDNLLDVDAEVSVLGVPSGLSPLITLNSDIEAVLTLEGNAIFNQNLDDISEITFVFKDEAFAASIAVEINNYDAASTGLGIDFNDQQSGISYSGAGFSEAEANDGSVNGSIIMTLTGETFQDDDADDILDLTTEIGINNIPSGLTPEITIDSNNPIGSQWIGFEAPLQHSSFQSAVYGNGIYVAVMPFSTDKVAYSFDGVNWRKATPANNNSWYGVAFGNGLFVCVSSNGDTYQVMTSPDGVNWTERESPQSSWSSVVYGDGLFVAVSYNDSGSGQVMTSPDGITWTAQTAIDGGWNSVTHGNGLFVAVDWNGGNNVMTSPDGVNWTARAGTGHVYWPSITYGNGIFVAVSDDDGADRIMTSADGINWTARTPPENNGWFSVTYGGGVFVAVAYDGDHPAMTSTDGINWTLRDCPENSGYSTVVYGDNRFVALANQNNPWMTSTPNAQATLKLTGKATNHQEMDDVADITFEFTDEAFENFSAASLINTTGPASSGLGIDFDVNGSAPIITNIADKSVAALGTLLFEVVATDSDEPVQVLNYTLDQPSIDLGMSINESTGIFNWTPSIEQIGNTYSVEVTVADEFLNATKSFQVSVAKANQAITFSALPAKTFGEEPFGLTANGGGSGNAVIFASSELSVATVSGSTVTIVGAGTTTITASQDGNDNYNTAAQINQELVVEKVGQVIVFETLSPKTYGDQPFDLVLTGGASNNVVSFTSSDESIASIADGQVTILGAGAVEITATQPGNANYNDALAVTQHLVIAKSTLTATAINQTRIYNTENPALTISYGSLIGGDVEADLDALPSASTTASTTSDVGAYEITLTGGADENYDFEYITGTLMITKAKAEVIVSGLEVESDGQPISVGISTNPEGLNVIVTYNGSADVPVAPGTYEVVATIDELNYEGSVTATLTVHEVTGVANLAEIGIEVYPNPAFDYLTIITNEDGVANLVDLNGRFVFSQSVESDRSSIILRGIPSGTYMLTVENHSGKILGQKRIIVRR
ncbi:MAG: LamG-like jellyroll fold domain-containing protein [Cyclobacteriaceae bacterium]